MEFSSSPANDNPSVLTDSRGRPIATNPDGIANFQEWFRDSRVVDKDTGRPLMLFHGTSRDFRQVVAVNNVYDQSDDGGLKRFHKWSHFGSLETASQFASDAERSHLYPVYLSIQNPLRIRDSGIQHTSEDLAVAARKGLAEIGIQEKDIPLDTMLGNHGFDGLVYENLYEGGGDCYIPRFPWQIKSAIGNPGFFNRNTPHITDDHEVPVGSRIDLARRHISRYLEAEASQPAAHTSRRALQV